MEEFISAFGSARILGPEQITFSILMSFILSQALAWTYGKTYSGLSYSRGYVHALILGSLVTCVLIMAIGNNLARGLGILGTLAIIRFRTQIRDPRDIIFLFAALAVGIACGASVFQVATIGTIAFCLVAMYLYWSPFASTRHFEGMLRFLQSKDFGMENELMSILNRYCSKVQLVSVREAIQGDSMEQSYEVRFHDPSYQSELLKELRLLDGLTEPSMLMHRSTVEV